MKFYHATDFENLESILDQGIKRGSDKVIYLCKKPDESARFVLIRGCKKILVIEVDVDENLVKESFDHSEQFFKCKAYMYNKDIKPDNLKDFIVYEI